MSESIRDEKALAALERLLADPSSDIALRAAELLLKWSESTRAAALQREYMSHQIGGSTPSPQLQN